MATVKAQALAAGLIRPFAGQGREMAKTENSIEIGTEAQARAMIGMSTEPRPGGVAVNEGMIRLVCSALEEGNPRYWEDGESPPGMLLAWTLGLLWAPGVKRLRPLCSDIPLPGDQTVNAGHEVEFHETIRVGDHLSVKETLVGISDEKDTHLGLGHFVQTRAEVTRQDGVVVATVNNNMFRYRRK